jgi:hypothetical protein
MQESHTLDIVDSVGNNWLGIEVRQDLDHQQPIHPLFKPFLVSRLGVCQADCGGGEGGSVGMYGTLKTKTTSVLLFLLALLTGLGPTSVLVDAGAGLGKPLVHAVLLGIGRAWGFEIDGRKVEKSQTYMRHKVINSVNRRFGETVWRQVPRVTQ